MAGLGYWLVNGAYGLFLLLYVYAAAAYGLTRTPQMFVFEWALGFTFAIWLIGHFLQGQLPKTGGWPWIVCGLVLGFGWFVTGMGILDDVITFGDHPTLENWFPSVLLDDWSTRDAPLSVTAMWRTTALLGGMLLAIDFWSDSSRGRILVLTMILSSCAMVLFFFLQRIVGPPFTLTGMDGKTLLAFATYRYHGNAAAYLNMFWPMIASVAIFAAIRQTFGWPFWFIPLAITFVATFLNISKAGNVLAVAGIAILLLVLIPFAVREIKRSGRTIRRSRVLVALVPVLIITASLPFAIPWHRWQHYQDSISDPGARMGAYAHFLKMVPDAGMPGFGPGVFVKYYGQYLSDDPRLKNAPYWVAHEDYIQTLVEWGYIGTTLWGLLLIPPSILLFRSAIKKPKPVPHEFEDYRISAADHLKAFLGTIPGPNTPCLAAGAFTGIALTALHSSVDFPMQILSLQFYFLTLIALGWSHARSEKAGPLSPSLSNPRDAEHP